MSTTVFAIPRCTVAVALLSYLNGCAGTTTQQAPLPPGAVEAEKEKQLELVLSENQKHQARLDEISYLILATGTSLCNENRGKRLGLTSATVHDYPRGLQPTAARGLGVNDTLLILSLPSSGPAARAGLKSGDRVIAIGSKAIQQGPGAAKHFAKLIAETESAPPDGISVMVQRGSVRERFNVQPEEICDYRTVVYNDTELNAYADGKGIYITSAMMRFVDDDELRVVVSHEFAHNAMGHIKAKKKNSLFGALVGALGDIAMASRGVNTGGYYTNQGAKLGAMTFSQDFEREADYVGIYALALADLPTSVAPNFWRRMAVADPKAISFAHSHPTTAERFVRLEQAITEVDRKIASNDVLRPNPARMSEQPTELDSNAVNYAGADSALPQGQAAVTGAAGIFGVGSTATGGVPQVGYDESPPRNEPSLQQALDAGSLGQPIIEAVLPAFMDSAAVAPDSPPSAEAAPWLGQPHGRVYYWASCQAARELPEPIYFKSEEDAQLVGYQRSQVPGC